MGNRSDVSTLVELLRQRACALPDQRAYSMLAEGETDPIHLTYAQLDREARTIAARLQSLHAAGERVLLLYPDGLEYLTAFFGCLYAGAVPIPAYPPRLNRPNPRIEAIAADAQAKFALTTASIADRLEAHRKHAAALQTLRYLGTAYPEPGQEAGLWDQPSLSGDSLAYIQYTSGSTATPRGVMLSHSNLLNNLAHLQQSFSIHPSTRGVSWLPLYHDMGLVGGVLLALHAGAPLAMMSSTDFARDPVRWLRAITRYRGTVSGGPSFAYQLCVDRITPEERASLDLSSWEAALCGAEPIHADTLHHFAETFAPCGFRPEAFCPAYGLAEATLLVSAKAPSTKPSVYTIQRSALERGLVVEQNGAQQPDRIFVGCGRPLPDHQVAIIDPESLARCAPDRVGEIWVSGPSVAQGYWSRPEETSRTFQALIAETGEGPFLRTGDLGFLKDGELVIAGRLKDLIIIRGRNYDPYDIEMVAQQSHPALEPGGGAAFSVPAGGEERLAIVHELRRSQRDANVEEVIRAIRHAVAESQELPVYAVALVRPGVIPRTSSGKTQRYLCREAFLAGQLETVAVDLLPAGAHAAEHDGHDTFTPPRTPLEMALAGIWGTTLGREHIGIHDNFFELGGDSLSAAQVASRLRRMFHVEVSLRSLFEAPTIAGLATCLEQILQEEPAPTIPPLEPVGRDGPLPPSFAQERIWFLHQLDPQSSAYNICGALRLVGQLNQEALQQTFHEIAHRHEALRTTFAALGGDPAQVIVPFTRPSVKRIDLRALPSHKREGKAMQFAENEARRPFDLSRGPLLRVSLLQLDDEEHILLYNMHHIISDAWSIGLLTGEVLKLYNAYVAGQAIQLPPLPIQYADFAVWQREWLRGEALEALFAYWQRQLDGVPVLELPTDHPRPAMQRYRGTFVSRDLPPDLVDTLKRLSTREGATLFMTSLAVFKVLLYRYTGQEDVAVGVPIANRSYFALEGVVGSFVNTLVMRTDLSGDPTFRQLLRRVRGVALDAYAHQDLPYAKLVAELRPERDTSRDPLTQVLFNVINVPIPTLELENLHATPLKVDRHGAQFDLSLTITDTGDPESMSIEYNTDLFEADTAERMLDHYQSLLEAIVDDPDRRISSLLMLGEAERQQLLVTWNDTRADYRADSTFVQLFEAQVERTPDAPALVLEGQQLSYQALNRGANQIAHHLQSLGVGPEVIVGVLLERSLDAVSSLLGVLKAGGAYLPLDPSHPTARLAFMLRDANVSVLLTQEPLVSRQLEHHAAVVCLDADRAPIEQQSTSNPVSYTDTDSLAYVLYTSGSTGRPKGVLGPYRGMMNRFAWMWHTYPFQAGEICCQKTSLSFIDSIWELFGPLLQGVPTVIIPDSVVRDPFALVQSLAANRVTRIVLVPSLLAALLETHSDLQDRLPDLRMWTCSGEPLWAELVYRFREAMPRGILLNLYGSSEVAADVTSYDTAQLDAGRTNVPVGRPIANTQTYILDEYLQPMPIGVPGELYIGGLSLARGYVNRPELTAERFIPHPFSDEPGARLYRTGDLARYLPSGEIELDGRRDDQVKIRGFRIELGEIEATLRQHPAVADAAAVVLGGNDGGLFSPEVTDRRLAAYVVPKEDHISSIEALLRTFLRDRLPSYMIPSALTLVDVLPLTPNGKLDRRALAELGQTRADETHGLVPPRDALERQMVEIWEQVLEVRPIGVQDSFFELGGHSLLAVRLFAQIEEALGVRLPIATLFRSPTVEQLCAAIREPANSPDWKTVVPIQTEGSRPPLFCVHGLGGGVLGYAELARLLGQDQPFYGLQARGLDGAEPPHTRIEEMAAHYVEAVRTVQPTGPYRLGGYSFGGVVAFEMARQLQAQGACVELVALFDTYAPLPSGVEGQLWRPLVLASFVRNLPRWLGDILRRRDGTGRLLARLRLAAKAAWRQTDPRDSAPLTDALVLDILGDGANSSEEHRHAVEAHLQALESYRPQVYPGHVTLFRVPGMRLLRASDDQFGWGKLAAGGVTVHKIAGAHYNILERPAVETLAAALRDSLFEIRGLQPDDLPQRDRRGR